jgi:hypothetical protein
VRIEDWTKDFAVYPQSPPFENGLHCQTAIGVPTCFRTHETLANA